MNVNRAGNQTKAYWRSQERYERQLQKEKRLYVVIQEMLQGHAAGWIAGVAWAKRKQKLKEAAQ